MGLESQMRHLNSNMLCAIDITHTNINPRKADIIEICILLLDNFIEPSTRLIPYYQMIMPFRIEDIDFETCSATKVQIQEAVTNGVEPSLAADRLEEWFKRLDMPWNKKIVPVTYNWPHIKEYLVTWLGFHTFESMFSYQFRDVLCIPTFINDHRNMRAKNPPYMRPDSLAYMCDQHSIPYKKTEDVMLRTKAIAAFYKKLLSNWI